MRQRIRITCRMAKKAFAEQNMKTLIVVFLCWACNTSAADTIVQPMQDSFIQAFTAGVLSNAIGISSKVGIDTMSSFENGPKGFINLYLVQSEWPRIPVLAIKISTNGAFYVQPPAEYHGAFQWNRVGSRSYGRDLITKRERIIGSELVFTSSCKGWDVSLFCRSKETKVDALTRLAKQINAWCVNWSKRGKSNCEDDPANGSQPIRSETNRTSSAAGSRR